MAPPTDRSPPPRIGSGDGTVPRKKQRRISKSSSSSKAPGTKNEASGVLLHDDGSGDEVCVFSLLDTDTRLKIFQFLSWQDLITVAPTSKSFRDDCAHPSVARDEDRQFTVHFQRSCASLFRKLVQLQNAGKFDNRCSRLKIVWHGGARLENPIYSWSTYRIRGDCVIPQVTDLELSVGTAPVDGEGGGGTTTTTTTTSYKSQGIALSEQALWGAVSEFVPNLRVLTVSPPPPTSSPSLSLSSHRTHHISPMAPCFMTYLRRFESLIFRGQVASTHLRGYDMGLPRGPLCIDLDDCIFDLSISNRVIDRFIAEPSGEELFGEDENDDDIGSDDNDDDDNEDDDGNIDIRRPDRQRPTTSFCIFQPYVTTLERVSIRNARYYTDVTEDGFTPVNVLELPQSGLIRFVRRATNLQWFRSDLTPENVAMLQRERPDVTFVS